MAWHACMHACILKGAPADHYYCACMQESYIKGAIAAFKQGMQAGGGHVTQHVMEALQLAVLLAVMFGFTSPPRLSCIRSARHPKYSSEACLLPDCRDKTRCKGNRLVKVRDFSPAQQQSNGRFHRPTPAIYNNMYHSLASASRVLMAAWSLSSLTTKMQLGCKHMATLQTMTP